MNVVLLIFICAALLATITPTALSDFVRNTLYAVPFLSDLSSGDASELSSFEAAIVAQSFMRSLVSLFVSPYAPKTNGCNPHE